MKTEIPSFPGGKHSPALNSFQLVWEDLLSLFPSAFDLLSDRAFSVKTFSKDPFTLKFLAFMFCFLSGFWKHTREFLYLNMLPLIFYNSVINCFSFIRDFLYLTTSLSFIFSMCCFYNDLFTGKKQILNLHFYFFIPNSQQCVCVFNRSVMSNSVQAHRM